MGWEIMRRINLDKMLLDFRTRTVGNQYGGEYLDVTLCLLMRMYGLYFTLYFHVLFSGMSLYAVILACHCLLT